MELSSALFLADCYLCGKEKKIKGKGNFLKLKDKLCQSCSNSISRGGLGNVYPVSGFKCCGGCKQLKPLKDFYFYQEKNRYHSLCNSCKKEVFKKYHKEIGRFKNHNISKEQYQDLLIKQNNRCAICSLKFDNLYIDHNHKNKEVRGLLCRDCNSAIGLLKESKESLLKAIEYLGGLQ